MKSKKLIILLTIVVITIIYGLTKIVNDCYEYDGAASARVYCEILDDRESY